MLAPPGGRTLRIHGRRGASALGGALVALLAACSSPPPPPPDTDATQATSVAISYASPHADRLDCEKSGGPDCADWFDFQPSAPGTMRLSVSPAPAGEKAPSAPFELSVVDEGGSVIGHSTAGAGPALVALEVKDPKVLYVSVALPPGAGRHDYVLGFDSQLRSAPPSPGTGAGAGGAPSGKTRRWSVLEVERKGGAAPTDVLIDGGRRDALRAGLRGRLVDGQRTLGRVVVVEVFEEGSRARVEGPLAGDITPETVAEIEVPADGR